MINSPGDESPARDPFAPPAVPVEVECLHCGQRYMSDKIRFVPRESGKPGEGDWVCPTPGCGAPGFGFDILPTDKNYRDEYGGWETCDDDEDVEDEPE